MFFVYTTYGILHLVLKRRKMYKLVYVKNTYCAIQCMPLYYDIYLYVTSIKMQTEVCCICSKYSQIYHVSYLITFNLWK